MAECGEAHGPGVEAASLFQLKEDDTEVHIVKEIRNTFCTCPRFVKQKEILSGDTNKLDFTPRDQQFTTAGKDLDGFLTLLVKENMRKVIVEMKNEGIEEKKRNMKLATKAEEPSEKKQSEQEKEEQGAEHARHQQQSNDPETVTFSFEEMISTEQGLNTFASRLVDAPWDKLKMFIAESKQRNMNLSMKAVVPTEIKAHREREISDSLEAKKKQKAEQNRHQQQTTDARDPDNVSLNSEEMSNTEQGLDTFIDSFVDDSLDKIKIDIAEERERQIKLKMKMFQGHQCTLLAPGFKANTPTFTRNEVDSKLSHISILNINQNVAVKKKKKRKRFSALRNFVSHLCCNRHPVNVE